MDFEQTFSGWEKELKEGSDDVEGLYISDSGCRYLRANIARVPDCIHSCMMKDGQHTAELYWVRGLAEKPYLEHVFLIKGQEKMIFSCPGKNGAEFHGFGFGEKKQGESISLYIRINNDMKQIFSDAASHKIVYTVDVKTENPLG